MTYKVLIPKKIMKFIEKFQNQNSIKEKLSRLKNFGSNNKLNLDIKSMKGDWRGYYRLRIGDLRFILKIIDNKIIFIEEADFRGKIYK